MKKRYLSDIIQTDEDINFNVSLIVKGLNNISECVIDEYKRIF